MSHFGAQYDDLLTALDANTTAVAARLDALMAECTISDAQAVKLKAISDHLKALGADSQVPVPALAAEPVAVDEAPVAVARASKAPKA